MDRIPLSEADGHMAELIDRVENGEEIVILRDGKPAVKLVPIAEATSVSSTARPRLLGIARGKIQVAEDFDETPDWLIDAFHGIDADKPLPDTVLRDIEAAKARRAKSGQ
jgi:prevent-host-death family protein